MTWPLICIGLYVLGAAAVGPCVLMDASWNDQRRDYVEAWAVIVLWPLQPMLHGGYIVWHWWINRRSANGREKQP